MIYWLGSSALIASILLYVFYPFWELRHGEYRIWHTDGWSSFSWKWQLALGDRRRDGTAITQWGAEMAVAREMRTVRRARPIVQTEPCAVCDQPSRVGHLTCSPDHEHLLNRALKELRQEAP